MTTAVADIGAEARTPFPDDVEQRTVPALLARRVADAADRVALIAESADGSETRLSFAELEQAAARVAGGLAELGIGRGDPVAVLVSNHAAIEGNLILHGALRIGAIVVPINVRSLASDVRWCLESTAAKALLFEPAQAEKAAEAARGLPAVRLVAVGGDGAGDTVGWESVAGHGPVDAVEVDPGDNACWVFTSGTTGYPKAVAHSHANCVACGIQVAEAWSLGPGDVYLNGHPFFTASGAVTSPLGALWAGATNVVEPGFAVTDTLERVQRLKATVVFWMTPALALLLAGDGLADADLTTVRRVLYGGQAMPREFHLEVNDRLARERGIEVVHMIGQSEAGPSGIMLDPRYHRERPGAVGSQGFSRELTGYALLDDAGREVSPGEQGELCYRTPSIMQGYVAAPEATREVIHGGWLHSGDICRYDEDGFVYFVDRAKDVIRRGGVNIASAEIEQALRPCPGVADIAAVPTPHDVLGEVVKVVVVRDEGATVDADDVIAFATEHLADFKVPRVVDFVDELPRNDMGKVRKSVLRG